jgi:ADP-ribose pyrophosphatase
MQNFFVKKIIYFFLLLPLIGIANEATRQKDSSLQEYLEFLEENCIEVCGDYKKGEIEIVTDIGMIKSIQERQRKKMLAEGFSQNESINASNIGVVYEDSYWMWVRDAVIFPSGVKGTYNRMLWKSNISGFAGVAVLPILPDGRVVLNLNYRHATRSWELELPRGKRDNNETAEQTAIRELQEETGLRVSEQIFLGEITPDTGVLASVIPVYAGKVRANGKTERSVSEAIHSNPVYTLAELKQGGKQGYIEVDMKNKKTKVKLSDAFLFYALFQAEIRGLL